MALTPIGAGFAIPQVLPHLQVGTFFRWEKGSFAKRMDMLAELCR